MCQALNVILFQCDGDSMEFICNHTVKYPDTKKTHQPLDFIILFLAS